MREPRYRFPDEVRTTTRAMASRMVQEGTIVQTPEQLATWMSERVAERESLERGGYSTAFTAPDLFPLLEVFVEQAGGPPPPADPPSARTNPGAWAALVVVILLVVAAAAAILLVR